MKSLPITVTTEAFDKSWVASIPCINKIFWQVESSIGNVVENIHMFSDGMSSQFSSRFRFHFLNGITMKLVIERSTEGLWWYWGKSKNFVFKNIKSGHYVIDAPLRFAQYANEICEFIFVHYTWVSIHKCQKPEDVENAKLIPDTLQVHKAIRRMDINCFTIHFFRLSLDEDPYYTQWYC